MPKEIQITVSPEVHADSNLLKTTIQKEGDFGAFFSFKILKRSIDARKNPIKYLLKIAVYENNIKVVESSNK